jgi:hypothetical protein
VLTIAPQLVDIGEHLGHSEIEPFGNLVADLGVAIERTRERRRVQHSNAVRLRELAYALREEMHAFGDHARRAHAVLAIRQGDRVTRRVDDDHVRPGHIAHHPPARDLPLQGADARLQMRIALGLLELAADLVLGHSELPRLLPELEGYVRERDQCERAGHREEAPRERSAEID